MQISSRLIISHLLDEDFKTATAHIWLEPWLSLSVGWSRKSEFGRWNHEQVDFIGQINKQNTHNFRTDHRIVMIQ
jgi:hypothetical protein